jgi:hypothetical protein
MAFTLFDQTWGIKYIVLGSGRENLADIDPNSINPDRPWIKDEHM